MIQARPAIVPDPQPDCAAILELIPAYSIGATDPDETAAVRAALPYCPEAQTALAEYARLNVAMHHSAPTVSAPPGLFGKIQAAIRAEGTSIVTAQPNTPVTANTDFGATQGVEPLRPSASQGMPAKSRARWTPGRLVAAAAILILLGAIGTNVVWLTRLNSLENQLTTARQENEARQTALLLLSGNVPNTRRIEIKSSQPVPPDSIDAPGAILVCDPGSPVGVLQVWGFPQLPPDQGFQVWLGRGTGETAFRASPGVFQVTEDGKATFLIRADEPLGQFERIGITTEPAGGSPAPTGTSIVRGNLSY